MIHITLHTPQLLLSSLIFLQLMFEDDEHLRSFKNPPDPISIGSVCFSKENEYIYIMSCVFSLWERGGRAFRPQLLVNI